MTSAPATYQGVYGLYTVTAQHRQEVLFYRLSLLLLALAQAGLLIQWRQWGPGFCWPWLLLMGLGLGGALRWVHIYVRPLHRSLQLFWLLGCLGAAVLAWRVGPAAILPTLVAQPLWIWAVGPFFAALAGLGFKEFFCFQRPEAIGLTLLFRCCCLVGSLVCLAPPSQQHYWGWKAFCYCCSPCGNSPWPLRPIWAISAFLPIWMPIGLDTRKPPALPGVFSERQG